MKSHAEARPARAFASVHPVLVVGFHKSGWLPADRKGGTADSRDSDERMARRRRPRQLGQLRQTSAIARSLSVEGPADWLDRVAWLAAASRKPPRRHEGGTGHTEIWLVHADSGVASWIDAGIAP